MPSNNQIEKSKLRLRAVSAFAKLVDEGLPVMQARKAIVHALQAEGIQISEATLARWSANCRWVTEDKWLSKLTPRYQGRTTLAPIPKDIWDAFIADLEANIERCSIAETWRRVGKGISCPQTFDRRLKRCRPDLHDKIKHRPYFVRQA